MVYRPNQLPYIYLAIGNLPEGICKISIDSTYCHLNTDSISFSIVGSSAKYDTIQVPYSSNTTPSVSVYFSKIDSLIGWLDSVRTRILHPRSPDTVGLIAFDSASPEIYQSSDTSMIYKTNFNALFIGYGLGVDTIVNDGDITFGFSVIYNRQFGYPESLSMIEEDVGDTLINFSPSYSISGFTTISGN